MGVLFQAFYWNCPAQENQDGTWWNYVAGKIPELQQAGFTALWMPPACKAANLGGPSMGYTLTTITTWATSTKRPARKRGSTKPS